MDAIELIPHGQAETKRWQLFGEARYSIDLSADDLFTRVIDLRTEVKASMKQHHRESKYLEALQLGLKLLANSTSYGTLVEVNVDEREDEQPATLYADKVRRIEAHNVEKPGNYFAGPMGALIPAAGRLLLAIAERLASDRGIGYVLCDTDSMAFARPHNMDRDTFRARVQEIADWFKPLSPYRGDGALLEIDKLNDWESQGHGRSLLGAPRRRGSACPLYCLAISAKRYVVYNKIHDEEVQSEGASTRAPAKPAGSEAGQGHGYRIRKFSSTVPGT